MRPAAGLSNEDSQHTGSEAEVMSRIRSWRRLLESRALNWILPGGTFGKENGGCAWPGSFKGPGMDRVV